MGEKDHYTKTILRIEMTLREILNVLVQKKKKGVQQAPTTEWLDKQQVMQMLHISDRTLFSMRKANRLPTYAIKGKMYFKLTDIERILNG
jgi:hypothetical protein